MKQEQQQQAQRLYFQTDLSKTQIAETLHISRSSLYEWIRENNWERLKKSAACIPAIIAENCYYIMSHYTEQLLSADRADKLLTKEEVDNLHKLSITINKVKNRSTLNESMEMFTGFMECVHAKAPWLVEDIQPLISDYISGRASIFTTSSMPANFTSTGHIPTPSEQDPAEALLDLQDNLAWAEKAKSNSNTEQPQSQTSTEQPQHTQTPKPTETSPAPSYSTSPSSFVTPHSTSPSPSERACPDPSSGAGERPSREDCVSHSTSPSLCVTSPSPSERVGERSNSTSPSPSERACPDPSSGAGVRPSIREQLRGTATSGPGKSFYKNRNRAAA